MAKISQKKFQGPIFRHIDKCLKKRWISSMIWTNFLLMLYLGHSLKSTLEIIQWDSVNTMWGNCFKKMEWPLLQFALNTMGTKCKLFSFFTFGIYFFRLCPWLLLSPSLAFVKKFRDFFLMQGTFEIFVPYGKMWKHVNKICWNKGWP